MSPLDNFRFSLRALGDNKMRASLTMLGIIIGVAAVVIAVSVGQGASANITNSISQLGSNLLTVLPGNSRDRPWARPEPAVFLRPWSRPMPTRSWSAAPRLSPPSARRCAAPSSPNPAQKPGAPP